MKKLFLLLLVPMLLVACGQTNTNEDDEVPKPIEVDLDVPEQAAASEDVLFTAVVSQDGELIDDAKVVYEIWLEGDKENSEMIDATHQGDGQYTLTFSFTVDGIYHVQSHVDARDLHTMPQKQITIGNPDMTETDQHDTDNASHEH